MYDIWLYWLKDGVPQQMLFVYYWQWVNWNRENRKSREVKPDCRFYAYQHQWTESLPGDMAIDTTTEHYTKCGSEDWVPKPIRMLRLLHT